MGGPMGGGQRSKDIKKKEKMYLLILFIPLISASIGGLFGRKLGDRGAGIITSSLIVTTSLLS